MTITIQIPDTAYKQLISGKTRMLGTIALVSPTEGNFNAYQRRKPNVHRDYIKLPHGRVSMSQENVRLTLNIALDEANIVPADAVLYECQEASTFIETMMQKGGRL